MKKSALRRWRWFEEGKLFNPVLAYVERLRLQPVTGVAAWHMGLWAFLIFVMSSIPGNRYPSLTIPQSDKMVHFLIYAPLGLFIARWLTSLPRSLWQALMFGAAYAASDEFHQLFVANRTCSAADWVVDCLGLTVGILGWQYFKIERGAQPISESFS